MMQIFQYPHKTLTQVSSAWNKDDSIQGYNDIEEFENDYINLMQSNQGMGLKNQFMTVMAFNWGLGTNYQVELRNSVESAVKTQKMLLWVKFT